MRAKYTAEFRRCATPGLLRLQSQVTGPKHTSPTWTNLFQINKKITQTAPTASIAMLSGTLRDVILDMYCSPLVANVVQMSYCRPTGEKHVVLLHEDV